MQNISSAPVNSIAALSCLGFVFYFMSGMRRLSLAQFAMNRLLHSSSCVLTLVVNVLKL